MPYIYFFELAFIEKERKRAQAVSHLHSQMKRSFLTLCSPHLRETEYGEPGSPVNMQRTSDPDPGLQ